MEQGISARIIERAVELLCRLVKTPHYKIGGTEPSPDEVVMEAFGTMLFEKYRILDLDFRLGVFKEILTAKLSEEVQKEFFQKCIGIDYDPDKIIADAANEADIPTCVFPPKSFVWLYSDRVETRFGYNASRVAHYLLPDGRWLVAQLFGPDVEKIIGQIMKGNTMGFQIEG